MVMTIGNVIIVVFMTFYVDYFIMILKKKNRVKIQQGNQKLQELRKIPMKTIEEQKEFIDIKYPKSGRFKWSWMMPLHFLWIFFEFFVMFQIFVYFFSYTNIEIAIWQAILFVMIAPIIFNIILGKFNLEKSDVGVFLGLKNKKEKNK